MNIGFEMSSAVGLSGGRISTGYPALKPQPRLYLEPVKYIYLMCGKEETRVLAQSFTLAHIKSAHDVPEKRVKVFDHYLALLSLKTYSLQIQSL